MIGLVSLFTDASSEMIYPLLPIFLTGVVTAGRAAVYVGLMSGISETTASLLFGVFWGVLGPGLAFGIGSGLAGVAAIMLRVVLSRAEKSS